MEYSRDQRRRHRQLQPTVLTMVLRIHNGENTVASINSAGKID
jgi:hypothetical protein